MSIFEQLINEQDNKIFIKLFMNNLHYVYQYDKKEVTDTVKNLTTDKLLFLRLHLFEVLIATYPDMEGAELYKRRKADLITEDIFVLGYCIVNKQKDLRLNKVLKLHSKVSQDEDHALSDPLGTLETADLVETCIGLRQSV